MSLSIRQVPTRIICLTEEPTEILYLLGQQKRIVGISAYTVRPECAKQSHPVVSAFIGGSIPKICALQPDLIIGFSDIQSQLAKDLIEANQQVLIFNQRSIQDILDVIMTLGAIVDERERASQLVGTYINRLNSAKARTQAAVHKPRVYFEEWDEPLITSIQWVSELIEIAGGTNIFADRSHGKLAKERFVTHQEIIDANPEIVAASWCGKPFEPKSFVSRPGYAHIEAVQQGHVHEIDSSIILQPGPACLTDGLDALEAIIRPDGLTP